ncbi:MAG: hypothetical protein AB7P40_09690 [Chloroflexota bacterium]
MSASVSPDRSRWPWASHRVTDGWLRLLFVVALMVLVLPSPIALSQVGPGASLTVVRGSVSVTRPDGTAVYPAGTGLTLAIGDIVGTLERTQAIVTFFSGSEIELGSNTTIIIRRLDRDLLDQANVTVEHLSGITVIRVNGGQPVRAISGDTIALIRNGEIGHGVDEVTNNVTVACVDGVNKCGPNGVSFPTESASMPGQIARVITGRGDRIDIKVPAGASVWDMMAEGGSVGQDDGTTDTQGTARERRNNDDDDTSPKPQTSGPTPTPTVTSVPPTPTPPAGIPGPRCGTATTPGGGQVTTTVHSIGVTGGTLHIDWDAFGVSDRFQIFYEGAQIFDSGFVTNNGNADIPFGPGTSTFIQIVVTGSTPVSIWNYTIGCLP